MQCTLLCVLLYIYSTSTEQYMRTVLSIGNQITSTAETIKDFVLM